MCTIRKHLTTLLLPTAILLFHSACSSSEPKDLSLKEFRFFSEHLCEHFALPGGQVRPAEGEQVHEDHINYNNENWYDGIVDIFTDIDPKVYLKVCVQIMKDKDRAQFTILDTGRPEAVYVHTVRPYPVARFSLDISKAGNLKGAGQAFELAREREPAIDQLLFAYVHAKACDEGKTAERLKLLNEKLKGKTTTLSSELKIAAAHLQTVPACMKKASNFPIPGFAAQWPLPCNQDVQCSPWGNCSAAGESSVTESRSCVAKSETCSTNFDCVGRGKCIGSQCRLGDSCLDWKTGRYNLPCTKP